MKIYLKDIARKIPKDVCYICGKKHSSHPPDLYQCDFCRKQMCGEHSYSPCFSGTVLTGNMHICIMCYRIFVRENPDRVNGIRENSLPLPVVMYP